MPIPPKEIQIHYNLYQNPSDIFHRIRKIIYNLDRTTTKIKCHSSLEEKKNHVALYCFISKHTTMLPWANSVESSLIQTQKHIPMEMHREPRAKQCIYSQLPFDKSTENKSQWKASLNKWCWKRWASMCSRVKLDPSSFPSYKDQLTVDPRHKCKTWSCESTRKTRRGGIKCKNSQKKWGQVRLLN